jgi:predicted RNase H-like nuclease (RuvC/YqgF family)
VPSLANHAYNWLRPALIAQGKLEANAAVQMIFNEDVPFNSVSAAAVAVLGTFGVAKAPELKAEQYADVVAAAKKAMA